MKNRLRTLRIERNWSQASLAERLEVSRQTVNALETGKSDPSLPLALKIAQLFDCTVETIFFLEQTSMFANRCSEDDTIQELNQQATEVLKFAQNESKRLRHNFVGTEQILLGLIAERTSFSARLLESLGVNLWKAQAEVQKIIGYGSTLIDRQRPLTPRAKRVLNLAAQEAARLGDRQIGTEHLLLGLTREGNGVSVSVLKNLGVNLADLEQNITAHLQQVNQSSQEPPLVTTTLNPGIGSELSDSNYPSDFACGEISTRLTARLMAWIEPQQLGRLVSQTGFRLAHGQVSSPQLAFIRRERLKRIPRTYPEIVPDLVVEIKSAFDRLSQLEAKIERFLTQGTQVGLLIDPDEQTVTCYRQGSEGIVLGNKDTLTIAELLPGWELSVAELWSPIFD